jgi:hypothetical protein
MRLPPLGLHGRRLWCVQTDRGGNPPDGNVGRYHRHCPTVRRVRKASPHRDHVRTSVMTAAENQVSGITGRHGSAVGIDGSDNSLAESQVNRTDATRRSRRTCWPCRARLTLRPCRTRRTLRPCWPYRLTPAPTDRVVAHSPCTDRAQTPIHLGLRTARPHQPALRSQRTGSPSQTGAFSISSDTRPFLGAITNIDDKP